MSGAFHSLLITHHSSLFLSSAHDEFIGALVVASLVAARRLAPRRHRMTTARGLAFAAAMRMIHRVHRHAAHFRAATEPARAARFAETDVGVFDIADLADGRVALNVDAANLTR